MILADAPAQVANSSLAGIIAAVAGVVTALAFLITALTLLIPILRTSRKNTEAIAQVHTIVNQQHTDLQRYQQALIKALTVAGVQVPDDQSIIIAPVSENPS